MVGALDSTRGMGSHLMLDHLKLLEHLLELSSCLHYANVSVGTPSLWFLVALDTGSDLFWLLCDCTSCVRSFSTTSGKFDFNIYSPNTSSTSNSVLCNSNFCQQEKQCSVASNACPYQVRYLSSNTSSTGFLVEDVLHLITDDSPLKAVDAPIKFGFKGYFMVNGLNSANWFTTTRMNLHPRVLVLFV